MFGAEPQDTWTEQETIEFDQQASARLRKSLVSIILPTAIFPVTILLLIPFLAGHSLHRYWEGAKYLLLAAFLELMWMLLRWGTVYSAWQSARETRKEMTP